jgi:uncharacterized protein YceK
MQSKRPIFAILAAGALLMAGCASITVRDDADDELAVQTAPSAAVQMAATSAAPQS